MTNEKLKMPSNRKINRLYEELKYAALSPHRHIIYLDELKEEMDAQWALAMAWRTKAIERKAQR